MKIYEFISKSDFTYSDESYSIHHYKAGEVISLPESYFSWGKKGYKFSFDNNQGKRVFECTWEDYWDRVINKRIYKFISRI